MGISVAGGGDWNADGLPDVLIGGVQLPFDDLGFNGTCPWPNQDFNRDRAWISLGWNAGCGTFPPACNQFDNSGNKTLQIANDPAAPRGDRLGWRVAFLGNIDGSPGDEIAISAPLADIPFQNCGTVYVISWQIDVMALPMSFDPEAGVPGGKVLRIRGTEAHDWFGYSLARGANVLGNTTPDLLVGAPAGQVPGLALSDIPPTSGKVFVIDGSNLGAALVAVEMNDVADFSLVSVEAPVPSPLPANTNSLILRGEALSSRFGYSVSAIGNLDGASGDQGSELAVGAIGAWWQCGGPSQGMVYSSGDLGAGTVKVYSISSGYVPTERKRIVGSARGDLFGYSVSGFGTAPQNPGGDATGDGIPDLLVGAPTNDGTGGAVDVGQVYLYSGAALNGGGNVSPDFQDEGAIGSEYYGFAVMGGGYLNHDVYVEFAAGSRNFSVTPPIVPSSACMAQASATPELFLRGTSIGRVRVFCGLRKADGTHDLIDEFWGMQGKGHLGISLCWIPSLDGNGFTELLMGMNGYQTCAPCADGDPGADIGRVEMWNY